ncbi:helix-turn-helix domain-containing protein [Geosporobacter ferrireducens]|uniref:helix-turn-helix domain-containing protein n=1 Tax=Geosporobacter ferrireducens TaxID=1424294 RepID=UPI00139DC421|nr:helix-turn-helix transcriptional regulator [Geosporobacter ferrireducens]MTI53816.1 helix-turn-helix transcriptional regulator [Geosporobacter ferrireducens]
MFFAQLLKEARIQYGLSQKALAKRLGVTQATWSLYENKKRQIPEDVIRKASVVLKNPRLLNQYVYETKSEFFNVPILKNEDESIFAILDILIERAKELIKHTQELQNFLKGKGSDTPITTQELERIMGSQEQIADLLAVIKLNLVVMIEQYGVDMELLENRINSRFKENSSVESDEQGSMIEK